MFVLSVKRFLLIGYIASTLASSVDVQNGHALSILGKLQAGQIRAGETLAALARRYHVGYDEVVAANPHIDIHHTVSYTHLTLPTTPYV